MTWARSSVPARCIEGNGVTHEVRSAITAVLSAALGAAISRTDLLVAELEEAFRKRTWAHRHQPRGPEMTAWQRAAAFIDGRVYGGGPPGRL